MNRRICILFIGIAFLAYAQLPNPIPIPQVPTVPPNHPLPAYIGAPATPNPVSTSAIPQNPFLAANGRSYGHNDAYASDIYFTGGPLGKSPYVLSTLLATSADPLGQVIATVFDQKGRIIAGVLGSKATRLALIDPVTLATLAMFNVTGGSVVGGSGLGVYYYLDSQDHLVLPVLREIWIIAVTDTTPPSFAKLGTYDLSAVVPDGQGVDYAMPDFTGRIWFATMAGVVGTLDPHSGAAVSVSLPTGERINNGVATDESGGLFLASDHAMYRFDADSQGRPQITWREPYDRGNRKKAGQFYQGTGTTPTIFGTANGPKYVTITDNADPQMHALVYRSDKTVEGSRLLCSAPVFQPGQSADENSIIATDKSLIVENNAGFKVDPVHGKVLGTSFPGMTRIDVDESGCHTVWTNDQVRIPSVVSKMSVANGLIYTYTYENGPGVGVNGAAGWYFTAVDFHTGRTVFQKLIGQGEAFDNYYSAMNLGPDGKTAYVGVTAGLVAIRDAQ
jgi:hypothetical protein